MLETPWQEVPAAQLEVLVHAGPQCPAVAVPSKMQKPEPVGPQSRSPWQTVHAGWTDAAPALPEEVERALWVGVPQATSRDRLAIARARMGGLIADGRGGTTSPYRLDFERWGSARFA